MREIARKVTAILGSRRFFYVVVAFLVFDALWIALSAVYPMPFDEDFHFGIIRLFSEVGPFVADQPLEGDAFGAIFRDPSFLYHYLMSFPYMVAKLFTDNPAAIVIFLRLINIGLMVWGLFLFRKLLLRAKISVALTHTALALFILIPIVPQLAAHVNYDNLLMVLVPSMGLLVARILDGLKKRRIDMAALGSLLLVAMTTSLVKYESLPIVAVMILFTGFMVYRRFRGSLKKVLARGWQNLPKQTAAALLFGFVLLFGLMIQRYGVNAWSYQSLKPECDLVLSEERCMAYGPWARDHQLSLTKGEVDPNPLSYTWTWLQALHFRLFFAISGPENGYTNYPPLPLPAGAAAIIAVMGLVAFLLYGRRALKGQPLLLLFLLMCATYVGSLWVLRNYPDFLATGQPVAINGRYLLPILLPLAAVFGRAISVALRGKPELKALLATLAILLFLQGGGVLTFISRSDPTWYWNNQFIVDMNDAARKVTSPIIIEGSKYY